MATQTRRLLIRADASTRMGTGHVMRCLALAQAWLEAGGEVTFAVADIPPGLAERLTKEGVTLHRLAVEPGSLGDSHTLADLARQWGADWLAIDGYQFGSGYQLSLKEAGLWLLVVDDYGHAGHYWADAVLNQNLHARESLYDNREPGVRLLLGTRYALLRREFWKWRGWGRPIPEVAGKFMVTLGGSDPDNVTRKVVGALARGGPGRCETVVVVGEGNPHMEELRSIVSSVPGPLRLVTQVTEMAELMAWADVGVAAGGSTSWELAFMGLPTLCLVLADNQEELAASLAGHGVVHNLGWHTALTEDRIGEALGDLALDPAARRQMSLRGRQLVDGLGGRRVVEVLLS
jgi:UDP-2,4-diacetamido-2,4,6-trideoxy-beta-L-altropyranose hydrolase